MSISRSDLERRHHSGSGWFTTIAVLSVINTVLIFADSSISFPVGLGTSLFAIAFLKHSPEKNTGLVLAIGLFLLAISFAIIATMWVCKVQARKGKLWAYILGLSIYAVDSLLSLVFQDWLGFGFHVWGIYSIWLGYQACKQLNAVLENPEELITTPEVTSSEA